MQAFSQPSPSVPPAPVYTEGMRKSDEKINRPPLAQRLVELRLAAGLTQTQLAKQLGVSHSNIAFWELKGTPPRGEVLPALAQALAVSVDELLGVKPLKPKRQAAKGRLQQVFEAASKLPRRQQDKVAEFVEAFVNQHSNSQRKVA
ncbi:MAG: helix-turn-helix transcriptional regulator [Verrucomicrobiales bacterium]|nr:helix-turn-helix transcriptional regulator [Verrucomicrobiales bacterium]